MAAVSVQCPGCQARYQVEEGMLGKNGTCPRCKSRFRLQRPPEGHPPGRAPARFATEAAVPDTWVPGDVLLDTYEVKGVLGAGAMGTVYRVRHAGWGLDLAVKSPQRPVLDRLGGIANFEGEARRWVDLGLHPHVVTCHYVRRLGGIPRVFAELVAGGSLHDWVRSGRLYAGGPSEGLGRVLDVAVQTAWGLQHTHEKGQVHQDFKPANVMMTPNGVARVTDFGLAVGTPAYMSPEQARRDRPTPQSDLWCWGVAVLEMFVGEVTWASGAVAAEALEHHLRAAPGPALPPIPPAVAEFLRRCFRLSPGERPNGMPEAAGAMAEAFGAACGCPYPRETPRPADALADELNNRALSLLDLGSTDEAHRCWGAAFREAPQHFESTYNQGLLDWRAGKITDEALLRRLLGTLASHPGRWRPRYLIARAHLERGDCGSALAVLDEIRGDDAYQEEVRAARILAKEGLPRAPGRVRSAPGLQESGRQRSLAEAFRPGDRVPLTPEVEAGLRRLGYALRMVSPGGREVGAVALSADGRHLLTGSQGGAGTGSAPGRLYLWESATGRCLKAFGEHTGFVMADLSPDAQHALTATGVATQLDRLTLSMWDVPRGDLVSRWDWQPGWKWYALDLDAAAQLLLVGGGEGGLELIDCRHRRTARRFPTGPDPVVAVHLAAPRGRAVTAHRSGLVRLWATDSGTLLREFAGHAAPAEVARLSPDGRFVLSGGQDGTVRLWDAEAGQCLRELAGHGEMVTAVALSPDGSLILSGSGLALAQKDTSLRLWDAATGRCLRTFPEAHWGAILLTADGRTAVRNAGTHVEFWNVAWDAGRPLAPLAVCRPRVSDDLLASEVAYRRALDEAARALDAGDACAAAARLREARGLPGCSRRPDALRQWARLYQHFPLARAQSPSPLRNAWEHRVLRGHRRGVRTGRFSPTGRLIASGGSEGDHAIRLWDAATGSCVRELADAHGGAVTALCWGRDESRLLSAGGRDHTLKVWDTASGRCVRQLDVVDWAYDARLTYDGLFALVGDHSGSVRLWEVATGRCLVCYGLHNHPVVSLDLTPDHTALVAGYRDHLASVWDYGNFRYLFGLGGNPGNATAFMYTDAHIQPSKNPVPTWGIGTALGSGRDGEVRAVRITADCRHIVTAGGSLLKLWELSGRHCTRVYYGHTGEVTSADLSPDGQFLLSGSTDGTMRLWHLAGGECLRVFTGHAAAVNAVAFGPRGQYALSASEDGTLTQWYLDWEVEERQPADWDPDAEHLLRTFLALHLPRRGPLPPDRVPGEAEVRAAIDRPRDRVRWTDADFPELLSELSRAGFGWLRPDGVRRELEKMTAAWRGPDGAAR